MYIAGKFQFPFFSVGKNFCQLRLLSRKDSELDEFSFFFSLWMIIRTTIHSNMGKLFYQDMSLISPYPPLGILIFIKKKFICHDLGDKSELPRDWTSKQLLCCECLILNWRLASLCLWFSVTPAAILLSWDISENGQDDKQHKSYNSE